MTSTSTGSDFPTVTGYTKNSGPERSSFAVSLSCQEPNSKDKILKYKYGLQFGAHRTNLLTPQQNPQQLNEFMLTVDVPLRQQADPDSASYRVSVVLLIFDAASFKELSQSYICDFTYEQQQQQPPSAVQIKNENEKPEGQNNNNSPSQTPTYLPLPIMNRNRGGGHIRGSSSISSSIDDLSNIYKNPSPSASAAYPQQQQQQQPQQQQHMYYYPQHYQQQQYQQPPPPPPPPQQQQQHDADYYDHSQQQQQQPQPQPQQLPPPQQAHQDWMEQQQQQPQQQPSMYSYDQYGAQYRGGGGSAVNYGYVGRPQQQYDPMGGAGAPPPPPAQQGGGRHMPPLVRTTALSQAATSLGNPQLTAHAPSSDGGMLASPPYRASLEILGDLDRMARDWTVQEWHAKRRLVQFRRSQSGPTISAEFMPLEPEDYNQNIPCISCIHWEERGECYVTSVDCIYLLEQLVNTKFSVEEKNRIRRNLEGYHPLTVSKGRAESGNFFRLIMSFSAPKPRNIEKDVKVFPWKILGQALKKIISKYSADYGHAAIPPPPPHHGIPSNPYAMAIPRQPHQQLPGPPPPPPLQQPPQAQPQPQPSPGQPSPISGTNPPTQPPGTIPGQYRAV